MTRYGLLECDVDQSFGRTLNTLRKAHYVLRQETESLARYGPIEAEALRRLRDTARSLQEQAHSLLVAMAYAVPMTALERFSKGVSLKSD